MLVALLVALFAGLATTAGGYLATHPKFADRAVLAIALAFAAGAMIFVSLVEMLPLGIESLTDSFGDSATAVAFGAFFVGMVVVAVIDKLLPHSLNPSELEGREDKLTASDKRINKRLLRSGFLVAFVLALHNFPEGVSTFFATYQDLSVGLTLALAIAIHNVPEGIAVAAPIYSATKSRKKAVLWSTLSGLAEPFGALVAALVLSFFVPTALFGVLFGLVAGMMVFLSFDELLPAAGRYAKRTHHVIYGAAGGMATVALSLVLVS